MAKKIFKPRSHDTGTVITTKTAFGSTADMIVNMEDYTIEGDKQVNDNEVVCKDDRGFYITFKNRIDSGIADPNRYANAKNRITLIEKKVSSS